jgi:hypothetical protein
MTRRSPLTAVRTVRLRGETAAIATTAISGL